ncbi:MAG: AtpZ/AtpI family protein [Ramlibacter sp.]
MPSDPTPSDLLARQVSAKADRKLRARRDGAPGVWFGLGTMGLIGWSVVVPTIAGAALGIWLDAHYPGTHAWSLALLMAGLVLGCLNAWRWVAQQDSAMHTTHDAPGNPAGAGSKTDPP